MEAFTFIKTMETTFRENKVIQEIHDMVFSMDSKTDNRIQLALKRAYDKEGQKRYSKLKDLGFNNLSTFKETEDTNVKELEEINDVMNEYAVLYPNHKFILQQDIHKVCEKYGLVLTSPDRFTGAIPEKNQRDIIDFEHKHDDEMFFLDKDAASNILTTASKVVKETRSSDRSSYRIPNTFSHMVSIAVKNYDRKINSRASELLLNHPPVGDFHFKVRSGIFLASTPDLVNMENCVVRNNTVTLDIEKYTPTKTVPDPIVFAKVPKGAIIITAWGEEASDPLVVNQNNN